MITGQGVENRKRCEEKGKLINAIGGGKGSHNEEGKNVLPLSMDEIQGPHSEGETAKDKAIMPY